LVPEPAWSFGEQKNLLPSPEIEPRAHSLVIIPTMLLQLATFMYADRWWLKVRKRYGTHFKIENI